MTFNTVTSADIEAQRKVVNDAYDRYGFHSPEYQQSFDRLHDMRMDFMADGYRSERGLPPNAKTPYCGTRWSH